MAWTDTGKNGWTMLVLKRYCQKKLLTFIQVFLLMLIVPFEMARVRMQPVRIIGGIIHYPSIHL